METYNITYTVISDDGEAVFSYEGLTEIFGAEFKAVRAYAESVNGVLFRDLEVVKTRPREVFCGWGFLAKP